MYTIFIYMHILYIYAYIHAICYMLPSCQNVLIFLLFIWLTRRIGRFWSKSIDIFLSRGKRNCWHIKSKTKNNQYSERFLE